MKKVMFVFGMLASVLLVSCGSRSGQRVPGKAVRVKEIGTSKVNFVRLNEVEQGIYRSGDTVRINSFTHSILYKMNETDKESRSIWYKGVDVILEK